MELSLEAFWEFISVLPDLSQLSSLALEFRNTATSTHDASIFPSHVQYLKALDLDLDITRSNMMKRDHSTQNHVNSVLRSFTKERPLQSLQHLKIRTGFTFDGSVLESLLTSLISVKSIDLVIYDSTILDILSTNHMTSLEALTVYPFKLLDYFDAPNLIELTVYGKDFVLRHFKLGSQIVKLNVSGWYFDEDNTQSLLETFNMKYRYLTLYSSISPGVICRFSFLEEIYFKGSGAPRKRKTANDFLLEMLKNNGSCPRLHTVKFEAFPLWEPLFEVMRRRMSENVQQITRLSFPALPHLYLLRHLV
jgi:hypothetical protein